MGVDIVDLDVLLALAHLPIHRFCQFVNQTAGEALPISVPVTACNEWVVFFIPHASLGVSLVSLLLLYTCYYLCSAVGAPEVVCSDPARGRWLRDHCPVFFEAYWPTVWAPQAHMQTILRAVVQRRSDLKIRGRRRENVSMNDGGHVSIDWYNEQSSLQPTVLILPGITGSSDEGYVQHWVDDLNKLGYRSVVFNYRGCGTTTLTTPRLYCGCDVTDLLQVVDHITAVLPEAPLMGVAVSMGSMMMIKYIAECKRRDLPCPLKAAMLVSVAWNLPIAERNMNKAMNRLTINRHLCKLFKNILKNNKALFRRHSEQGKLCFDYDKALQCQYMDEMAHTVTLPMFGYRDLTHLYREGSPHLHTSHLHIPIIAINSVDDPFCPKHAVPKDDVMNNSNIVLVMTKRGGHIGFLEGILPSPKTLVDRALSQFAFAVFEKGVAT